MKMAEEKQPVKPVAKDGKLAVVRIRSALQASGEVKATLVMLKLLRKNACAVVTDNPSMRGMLVKVKDYCAFGSIDAETLKLLQDKRGKKDKDGNVKNIFMLHPPRGGFERKGVKKPFNLGGALGDRRVKMNDLIKKMI